jgi:signal transduction histidine kinase
MVGADDSDPGRHGAGPVDAGSLAGPARAPVRRQVDLTSALSAVVSGSGDALAGEAVLTVVHQLRSPLAAIVGAAAVLDGVVADDHQHFVEVIDRNARRALRLVDELERQGPTTAGVAPPAAPVDLRRVALDAVEDAAQGGLLRHHRVRSVGDAQPALVLGDRDRLSQVFDNLLHNAVAYTPRDGTVYVAVDVEGDHVRAWVQDTGRGIPARERGRVFERFYRGAEVVARGIPGTGLGLAVVREVAEAHGGTAGAESVAGGGTRVWVRLPRHP